MAYSNLFYYKSRENLYQYCNQAGIRIWCYKSRALHLNMQWNWRFVIINTVPSYNEEKKAQKKKHSFIAIGIVTHAAHS